MNTGPNHPAPNGEGRGRRRRRGRRGHGAPNAQNQAQQQPNPNNQQGPEEQPQGSPQASQAPQQGQQHHPRPQQRRQHRPKQHPPRQNKQNFQGRGQQQQSGGRGPQQRKFGPKNRNQNRTVNPKAPDAGIYSAPMDHKYRSNRDIDGNSNGNGGGRYGSFNDTGLEAIPHGNGNRPIFAFVDDLFFVAKIQETARKLNVKVDFVKADKEVLENITNSEEKPALIIFDLNSLTGKPLTVIPKLKAKLKKATNIIGFVSHVQGELKLKAQEAGCDMVVPRSAFSQNLPQLLRRHAAGDLHEGEAQA